jgi:glycosyltransferase involved in cell wall biosynthesis
MGWVLERRPDVVFLCSAVQGNVKAKAWADERGIVRSVRLLPQVTHAEMADYFRLAQVMVSPSDHDGTPNTLLEAMACGAMPVVGDIEPIHEWLTDGENALIVDQRDPAAIGAAILRALGDETLRRSAAAVNWRMVQDRAAYDTSMARAEELYRAVIASVR